MARSRTSAAIIESAWHDPTSPLRPRCGRYIQFTDSLCTILGNRVLPGCAPALAGLIARGLASVSAAARREAGRHLNFVQHGGEPGDWKPMPIIGAGVIEIRIRAAGEHRVVVVATFDRGVFVLHAFEKKSRKTPRRAIDLTRRRYRELMREREGR